MEPSERTVDPFTLSVLREQFVKKPKGYMTLQQREDGTSMRSPKGLMVISSIQRQGEDVWLHVSYSYPNKTPTHADTCRIKNDFFGENIYAYAIFPPKEKYVNLHKHCLHLWGCMNDDQKLPEFSGFIKGIGRSI